MPKRWLVKSRWLVVLEVTMNTEAAATREVLVCGRWRAVVGKIFVVKLYSCKIFSYVSVYENIFATRKTELRYNSL